MRMDISMLIIFLFATAFFCGLIISTVALTNTYAQGQEEEQSMDSSCPENRELDNGFCCPESYHAGYELNPDRKKCVHNDLIIIEEQKTCPDGTKVDPDEDCPDDEEKKQKTCPDGTKVDADEDCPERSVIFPSDPNPASPIGPAAPSTPGFTAGPFPWIVVATLIGGVVAAYSKIRSGGKNDKGHSEGTIEVTTEGGIEE